MRIIAGKWRGRPLSPPGGAATRPTADRVREALFSMLASRVGSFEGLRAADLFAGTGALGLEALSRGASHCTFVENDPAAVSVLRGNIGRLGADACTDVLARDVRHVAPPSHLADLVFMDPPYGTGLAQSALEAARVWAAPGAWISVELSGEALSPPQSLEIETERRIGKANLILLRRR